MLQVQSTIIEGVEGVLWLPPHIYMTTLVKLLYVLLQVIGIALSIMGRLHYLSKFGVWNMTFVKYIKIL